MIPSSPTISSFSSSDLDTESTGSFFPDRSTSLGSLMGVSFTDVSFSRPGISANTRPRRQQHPPPQRRPTLPEAAVVETRSRRSRPVWWRLCREEDIGRRTSLGEFLQVERRFSCGGDDEGGEWHGDGGGGRLFEDGRVMPPPLPQRQKQRHHVRRSLQQRDVDGGGSGGGGLVRLPVLLAGICSGCEG